MTSDDVSEDGMTNHDLTDAQLEALLEGPTGSSLDDHPIAGFLGDARAAFSAVEAPEPVGALSEFVGVDRSTSQINTTPTAPVVDVPLHDVTIIDSVGVPRRRSRMIPALTAFIGTTIGKIAVGGSVAFAATAGAHATGVVDVPGLPDQTPSIVDVLDDGTSDGASASTDSTPSTTIGVGSDDSRSSDSSTSPTVSTTSSTSSSSSTSSTSSIAPVGQGAIVTISVLDAGAVDVRFDATQPTLLSSSPADGWQSRIDDSDEPGEIDLIFTNGSQRVDFSMEYEDGFARARVRDRSTESETFSWYSLEDGSLVSGPVDDDRDDDDSDDDDSDDDDSDDDDSDDDSDDDDRDDEDDSDDDDDDDRDDDDSDDDDDRDDDDSDDDDRDDDDDDGDDDSDDDN